MVDFDQITQLLVLKNISQREFSRLLGVHPQTITDWKKGKSDSFHKRLPEIADILNVSVEKLLKLEETPKSERLSDNEIKFALFGEANVTDAQLEDVKRYAKFVLEKYGEKHD